MLKTTQEQYNNILKLHQEGLKQTWQNACQADDALCQTELSEDAWDHERDQVKFLFQAFVKYSLFVEDFLQTTALPPHLQNNQKELMEVVKKRQQAESYLRSGFVKLTSGEKLEINHQMDAIEKMLRDAGISDA